MEIQENSKHFMNLLQKIKHCYNEKGKRCVIKTHSQEVFKKYVSNKN